MRDREVFLTTKKSYEEEDTCMSYEEKDTCISCMEEDTCMSHRREVLLTIK